jgi:putative ABC transport system permease protein
LSADPPRLAERLVRAALKESAFASPLVGDLREGYELRAERGEAARVWYWRQAFSIAVHFWLLRLTHPRIGRDLTHVVRRLGQAPAFTIAVVATLALGIGANAAILGLIDAFYLRTIPVPHPERIIAIHTTDKREPPGRGVRAGEWSSMNIYSALRRHGVAGATSLAAYAMTTIDASDTSGESAAWTALVYGDYFETLGIAAQRGRLIRADESDSLSAAPVLVISDNFWRERLSADEGVVGRTMSVGGTVFTIVGVAPPDFTGIHPEGRTDLWIPGGMARVAKGLPATAKTAVAPAVAIFGRLSPGATVATVQTSCNVIARDLAAATAGGGFDHLGLLVRVRDRLTSVEASPNAVTAFVILWVMVLLLHIAACTNVTTLMMARLSARRREIGIRLCLGASRLDIVSLSLLEAGTLALLGAIGGLVIGHWIMLLLSRMQFLSALNVSIDLRVVAIIATVSAATTLYFGLLPALHASRTDPLGIVRGMPSNGARAGKERSDVLLIIQVVVSVAILANAAAFVGLFRRQANADPGYDVNHVLVGTLPDVSRGRRSLQPLARYDDAMTRIAGGTGIRVVAAAVGAPLYDTRWYGELSVAEVAAPTMPSQTALQAVGPRYFAALGATLVRGREFTEEDRALSEARLDDFDLVIVNEALARRLFAGDAIGKRLRLGRSQVATVVGVVRDMHDVSSMVEVPRAYFPLLESTFDHFDVIVRTADDAVAVVPLVRAELTEHGNRPPPNVRTLAEIRDGALSMSRSAGTGLSMAAGVALGLMMIGIYGIVSMAAARRKTELSIRTALGARPADTYRLLLGGILRVLVVGSTIGGVCGFAIIAVERSWLGPVLGMDVPLGGIALACLLLAAAIAAFVPARRAVNESPANALRSV